MHCPCYLTAILKHNETYHDVHINTFAQHPLYTGTTRPAHKMPGQTQSLWMKWMIAQASIELVHLLRIYPEPSVILSRLPITEHV